MVYRLTRRCGGETHTRTDYFATLRDARRAEQEWLDEIIVDRKRGVSFAIDPHHDLYNPLYWDHSEITKITKSEALALLNCQHNVDQQERDDDQQEDN